MVNFNADKDLTPISIFIDGPFALAVSSSLPVKSIPELIAYARQRPGELSYASGGVGSLTQIASALFAERAGLKLNHVPYRGGGPAFADFLAGHVQLYFGSASELIPFANDEHIRILAVSTEKRLPQLPDIPAVAETFPGFKLTSWNGLLGPANLPRDIVDRLAAATANAVKDPKVNKALRDIGVEPVGDTPAEFKRRIDEERPVLKEALDAAGVSAR